MRVHHSIEREPGLGPTHSTNPRPNFSNQIKEIRGPSEPSRVSEGLPFALQVFLGNTGKLSLFRLGCWQQGCEPPFYRDDIQKKKKVRVHHSKERVPGLGPMHSTNPRPNCSNQIKEIRGPSEPFCAPKPDFQHSNTLRTKLQGHIHTTP